MKPITNVHIALLAALVLVSCRGQISEKEPIHPNMNMDQQNRFEAQEKNTFFDDNRSMRTPVEGTIARGNLRDDITYYEGRNEDGSYVKNIPVEVSRSFLERGRNQYNIYCTPCHGKAGDGQGIIMTGQYGYVPAPTYHQDRLREVNDGYLYSTITNGIRTMPSYAHQVKVEDRWAIVAYIRALQRSQYVPEEEMKEYDVDIAALKQEYQDQLARQQAREEVQEEAAGEAEITVERGKELYIQNGCQACHSRDGSDGIGPTHLNVFNREETLADGTTITANEEYLKESIAQPNAKVVEGYDPVMAPYGFLSDAELQSIVEYLKTLSDNQ